MRTKIKLSPLVLFFALPFLSIFGALLVNISGSNFILLSLIVIISVLVTLTTVSDKLIPKKLYPFAILMISLSLLFHSSLVSNYLTGHDVHFEYIAFKSVEENSYWNAIAPDMYNAMLSVTILPAMYSCLLNVEGVWIFKIIYPLIFSLVPLLLYRIYQKQTDKSTAFLSVFFFMSNATFYTEMIALGKQMIAELFFVLLILLILDKKMNPLKRTTLSIVFSAALVVSHYALAYIYMFYILFAYFISQTSYSTKNSALKVNKNVTGTSVAVLFLIALSWYIHVSSSASFEAIVKIGDHMYTGIIANFLNPETIDPNILKAVGISPVVSFGHEIGRFMRAITQFFISVGFIKLIVKHKEMKFDKEYFSMMLISGIILLMSMLLPYFALGMNATRIHHLTLLFLSPLCISGGTLIFSLMSKLKPASSYVANGFANVDFKTLLVSLVVTLFFLSQVGFIYEVTGDVPTSSSLSHDKVLYCLTHKQDIIAAEWLSRNLSIDRPTEPTPANLSDRVVTDYFSYLPLRAYGFLDWYQLGRIVWPEEDPFGYKYIFLNYGAATTGKIWIQHKWETSLVPLRDAPFLNKTNKIYDGGSHIYELTEHS